MARTAASSEASDLNAAAAAACTTGGLFVQGADANSLGALLQIGLGRLGELLEDVA